MGTEFFKLPREHDAVKLTKLLLNNQLPWYSSPSGCAVNFAASNLCANFKRPITMESSCLPY